MTDELRAKVRAAAQQVRLGGCMRSYLLAKADLSFLTGMGGSPSGCAAGADTSVHLIMPGSRLQNRLQSWSCAPESEAGPRE